MVVPQDGRRRGQLLPRRYRGGGRGRRWRDPAGRRLVEVRRGGVDVLVYAVRFHGQVRLSAVAEHLDRPAGVVDQFQLGTGGDRPDGQAGYRWIDAGHHAPVVAGHRYVRAVGTGRRPDEQRPDDADEYGGQETHQPTALRSAWTVAVTGLPLTSRVGVSLMFFAAAASVLLAIHAEYFSARTHWANPESDSPMPVPS